MKDVGEPGDREGHARIDGGWLETDAKVMVAEMGASLETPGMSAGTYCLTAPRQPPTLLRTGNASDKFRQLDCYVVKRLRRFLVRRYGRNLQARQARLWTEDWLNIQGLYRLRGTIRYPEAA